MKLGEKGSEMSVTWVLSLAWIWKNYDKNLNRNM